MVNLRFRREVESGVKEEDAVGWRAGPRGCSRSLIVAGEYPGDHLIIVIA